MSELALDLYNALSEIVKLRARIAELEAEPRWISVRERLPEINTRVLAITPEGYMEVDYKYSGTSVYCGLAEFYSLDNVTHWMPLPEPPKERE